MAIMELTQLSDAALNQLVDDCYTEFHFREAQKTAAGAYHELTGRKNSDGYLIWQTPPTLFQAYLPDMLVEHKGKVWRNTLGRMNMNEPGGNNSGWLEFVAPEVSAAENPDTFVDPKPAETTPAGDGATTPGGSTPEGGTPGTSAGA